MTPRTLFTIIIKIIGISLIPDFITTVSSFFSSIAFFMKEDESGFSAGATFVIAALALTLFIILIRLCLFKTDYVIDKLSLDKHFKEEAFEINIHRSTVLGVAIIVVGALMITNAAPLFCRYVMQYLQQSESARFLESPFSSYIIIEGAKTFVGYMLISRNKDLVNLIEKKRKE